MTHGLANRIALVNGLVVFLTAVAIGLLPADLRPWTPVSITPMALVLALIAAWRSRVHARAWINRPGPAWRGVIEAAALGPVLTALILLPALVADPLKAGAYASLVADFARVQVPIGLLAGLILRVVALLQLRRADPIGAATPS